MGGKYPGCGVRYTDYERTRVLRTHSRKLARENSTHLTHSRKLTKTHSIAHARTHENSLTHALTKTHSRTHENSLSHSLTKTLSLTKTHSLTHSRKLTHALTKTHSLPRCASWNTVSRKCVCMMFVCMSRMASRKKVRRIYNVNVCVSTGGSQSFGNGFNPRAQPLSGTPHEVANVIVSGSVGGGSLLLEPPALEAGASLNQYAATTEVGID